MKHWSASGVHCFAKDNKSRAIFGIGWDRVAERFHLFIGPFHFTATKDY